MQSEITSVRAVMERSATENSSNVATVHFCYSILTMEQMKCNVNGTAHTVVAHIIQMIIIQLQFPSIIQSILATLNLLFRFYAPQLYCFASNKSDKDKQRFFRKEDERNVLISGSKCTLGTQTSSRNDLNRILPIVP